MGLWDSFLKSIRLPKKEAMFHLNRKGMMHTITYLFVLLTVLFLPDLIGTIMHLDSSLEEVSRGLYLAQVFVFYPLLIIFLIIAGVSILAGGGLLLRKALSRKLTYQQLWKLTSYASTIPLILSVIFKNIAVPDRVSALLFIVILLWMMYRMITVYPRVPSKRVS